ncbi:MAG TPA: amidohydrolase family protein [Candidatus Limnocylindria bacterium]|nr:amidohydrolase family protein [Candidatus Limnocylindria bacterium]
MEVIDIHHHLGSLTGGSLQEGDGWQERDYQNRVRIMEANGVTAAAILAATGYVQADGIRDTMRCNDTVAAYRKLDPQRFPVACGIVEPLHGARSLGELERIKHELHLDGVVWHTRFQGVAVDHPLMRPLLKKVSELGLVPVMHTNAESNLEAVWRLERLAVEFPELTFVSMDALTTNTNSQLALDIAKRTPNILFDTAHVRGSAYVRSFVEAVGSERLIFGSLFYSQPASYEHCHALAEIKAAPISDQDKANILAQNAKRLFGLI